MKDKLIGLDFETYGSVDLRKHGLDRYIKDPCFRPLLASTVTKTELGRPPDIVTLDFTSKIEENSEALARLIGDRKIVAHNAPFEKAVLGWMGLNYPAEQFIDSAVVARACGAGSSLEAAAPQLLNTNKMEAGKNLISLFSIPGKLQEEKETLEFLDDVVVRNPEEWQLFKDYCELDATLGLDIVLRYLRRLPPKELDYQAITMRMNEVGWRVDVAIVEEMQRRYLENQEAALVRFREACKAPDLNLNSLKQMKEWCAERGVRATSFDEKKVDMLLTRLNKKLGDDSLPQDKWAKYDEVRDLLMTKQILGGSSLKKLQTILDTVGPDGRLRDQYLHVGAGQTFRTTGRSVQMQNLKRIGTPADMDTLLDDDYEWTNEDLSLNLRQVFTATEKRGRLIVGDFSSVESRGLAWLAGEDWKLQSYRQGLDIYKMQAVKIFKIAYDQVVKEQRQTGKVGELSCGYQAGPEAVRTFAQNMGVEMSEGEAAKLVLEWREANPKIVQFWERLDEALHMALTSTGSSVELADGFAFRTRVTESPQSLVQQFGSTTSITVEVFDKEGDVFLRRVFHGCHSHGRNIRYFKPSNRKTGDLWRSTFVDPKTKQVRHYEIYGGKLAGILTQSFCRELFFASLNKVDLLCASAPNLKLVGQFHDEIVVDWSPSSEVGSLTLEEAMQQIHQAMSHPGPAKSFPLEAELKHDYRYTK